MFSKLAIAPNKTPNEIIKSALIFIDDATNSKDSRDTQSELEMFMALLEVQFKKNLRVIQQKRKFFRSKDEFNSYVSSIYPTALVKPAKFTVPSTKRSFSLAASANSGFNRNRWNGNSWIRPFHLKSNASLKTLGCFMKKGLTR